MAIIFIAGPAGAGKTTLANALRNNAISHGRGALLVDDTNDGLVVPLIEKMILGDPLPEKIPADWASSIPWKSDPTLIFVGAKGDQVFRAACDLLPGFEVKFGPVRTISIAFD